MTYSEDLGMREAEERHGGGNVAEEEGFWIDWFIEFGSNFKPQQIPEEKKENRKTVSVSDGVWLVRKCFLRVEKS